MNFVRSFFFLFIPKDNCYNWFNKFRICFGYKLYSCAIEWQSRPQKSRHSFRLIPTICYSSLLPVSLPVYILTYIHMCITIFFIKHGTIFNHLQFKAISTLVNIIFKFMNLTLSQHFRIIHLKSQTSARQLALVSS